MSIPIVLRRAVEVDLSSIVRIDQIALRNSERMEAILSSIAAQTCWVAHADLDGGGGLMAFGILDQSFFRQSFVSLLVVNEAVRGRGVATALMTALEFQCAGAKLFTSTNMSNLPARRLFNKLGYVVSGWVENLDVGDLELVFVKIIERERIA